MTALAAGAFAGCTGSDSTDETTDAATTDETASSTTTNGSESDAGGETTDADETETTESGSAERTLAVGEQVDDEQLSMVVRDVSKTDQLGEFTKAGDGNTFVVVRLAVKNATKDTYLSFSGFLQTRLKDASGYTYDQSLAATGQTFTGGQLVPGEVSRGDLVYEVPKDASGLTLQFDFEAVSFLTVERVTVDLESTADSVADLKQDLGVNVHDPGKSVSHGGVGVTVNGVEYADKLGDFAKAEEGHQFAIVDITTKNDTGKAQNISTELQMLTKDETGRSYSLSIDAATALDRPYDEGSALADGEKRRGKVAYEVPKDDSPLYWTFEFSLWTDGDKTFWKLR
jgi:hypothetical protein